MNIAENKPSATIASILKIKSTSNQEPTVQQASPYRYHDVLETSKGVDFFQRLPVEITTLIVSELDVRSVIALRSVNKCAKATIESFTKATTFLQNFFLEFLVTGSNGWETFVQLGKLRHCRPKGDAKLAVDTNAHPNFHSTKTHYFWLDNLDNDQQDKPQTCYIQARNEFGHPVGDPTELELELSQYFPSGGYDVRCLGSDSPTNTVMMLAYAILEPNQDIETQVVPYMNFSICLQTKKILCMVLPTGAPVPSNTPLISLPLSTRQPSLMSLMLLVPPSSFNQIIGHFRGVTVEAKRSRMKWDLWRQNTITGASRCVKEDVFASEPPGFGLNVVRMLPLSLNLEDDSDSEENEAYLLALTHHISPSTQKVVRQAIVLSLSTGSILAKLRLGAPKDDQEVEYQHIWHDLALEQVDQETIGLSPTIQEVLPAAPGGVKKCRIHVQRERKCSDIGTETAFNTLTWTFDISISEPKEADEGRDARVRMEPKWLSTHLLWATPRHREERAAYRANFDALFDGEYIILNPMKGCALFQVTWPNGKGQTTKIVDFLEEVPLRRAFTDWEGVEEIGERVSWELRWFGESGSTKIVLPLGWKGVEHEVLVGLSHGIEEESPVDEEGNPRELVRHALDGPIIAGVPKSVDMDEIAFSWFLLFLN